MKSTVLVLGLSSCLLEMAGAYAQSGVSPQQPAIINIKAIRASVAVGSPIEIRIRLTNTSAQDINASASYDNGLNISYQYEVRTTSGSVLRPKPLPEDHAISGTSKIRSLKPGESAEDMTDLSKEYEMTSPGEYVVQLSRTVTEGAISETVKSNELTITVTP